MMHGQKNIKQLYLFWYGVYRKIFFEKRRPSRCLLRRNSGSRLYRNCVIYVSVLTSNVQM